MNKNLFKTFAIAAMAVLAGACAKEQVGSADGETVEMTFNVDVPETTITTKGLSDAAQVDELVFQAFLRGAKDQNNHYIYTPVPELTQTVPVVDKKATVKVSLVKGQTYSFAFWAQTKGPGYYDTSDLRAVKMNTDIVKANDPKMDAFFAIKNEARVTVSYSETVRLKRALAQVNFGTKKYSGRSDELKAQKSYVTLTGVPNVFHPFMSGDSFACEGSETVKFNENEVISDETLSVNDAEYSYLASVYVFALNPNNTITDASAVVTLSNGKTTTIKAPNVPICRNFRTNILGDLLSVDGEWNITITEGFDKNVTYDAVSANLMKGATVTLSEDYKVSKDDWKGINIPVGTESVLNLNGHRFANEDNGYTEDAKSALVVKGKLTINGDGEVFCEGNTTRKPNVETQPSNTCISVMEGGHLIINGGNYSVGTDVDTKCNATIYVENVGKAGKVEIYGGTFTNAQDLEGHHSFVLNQDDQLTEKCITVYGGTFIGFNPADNTSDGAHTNYVAEGYKSVKISESPETWQVVDASKTISDQAGLNSALGEASTGDYLKLPAGTYTLPELTKSVEGVTFEGKLGADGNPLTVIDLASVAYTPSDNGRPYKDVTFKNISFITWTDNYKGFRHSENLLFEGCTFTGKHFAYGKETYKKCKFIQNVVDYNIWTYSSNEISFNECVFNCAGKGALVYKEAGANRLKVTFNDCKFIASAPAAGKAAIEIDSSLNPYEVYINNCTSEGFDNGTKSGNSLWNNKAGDSSNLKVVVDGVPQTLN